MVAAGVKYAGRAAVVGAGSFDCTTVSVTRDAGGPEYKLL